MKLSNEILVLRNIGDSNSKTDYNSLKESAFSSLSLSLSLSLATVVNTLISIFGTVFVRLSVSQ